MQTSRRFCLAQVTSFKWDAYIWRWLHHVSCQGEKSRSLFTTNNLTPRCCHQKLESQILFTSENKRWHVNIHLQLIEQLFIDIHFAQTAIWFEVEMWMPMVGWSHYGRETFFSRISYICIDSYLSVISSFTPNSWVCTVKFSCFKYLTDEEVRRRDYPAWSR